MLLRLNLKTLLFMGALSAPVLLIAGCGMMPGTGSGVASPNISSSIGGILHGGPNPIIGATVKLYATQSNGYNGAGLLLGTTTTDSKGGFNFGGTASACPSGQQAYITAAAGNTGGNSANPNSLLMAALGDCSTINQNTHIWIDELTTVAAGYALSNFTSISGSGASVTVNVSAPTTNNVTPANATCTGTGSSMVCNAAGLTHAFQNAANLVDAVQQGSSYPTGVAFSAPPTNANGIVPALLINTLGNILQSCVNSLGGASGDNSSCGNLFLNTTPPTTSVASPVTPTNTLQAIVNLAKYPSMTPAQVTALFGLQAATVFYMPQLATAPNDYSMAVIYKGPTGSSNFIYGFYTTLDVADRLYTMSEVANGGSPPVTINSMASNGSGGSSFSSTLSTALCTAGSPCVAATDTAGHLWLANTYTTNLNVYEFDAGSGSLVNTFALPTGTAPNSVAVDRLNTVYVTSANATANNLFQKNTAASSFTPLQVNGASVTEGTASPEYITVDAAGSLWNTNYNSTTTATLTYIQNTGSVSAPAFANPAATATVTGAATTTGNTYTVMLDGSGNAWANNITSLFKVTNTGGTLSTGSLITITGVGGNSSTTPAAAGSARFSTLDGDGNIFLPDNSNNRLYQYFPATNSFIYLSPCAGSTGTCLATASGPRPIATPRNAITDSTGSIWITNPIAAATNTTYGNVTQIIGTGAPTWGQMSYGHPGVRP